MSQSTKISNDELLHRLHDGELDAVERRGLEASLAGDLLAQQKLAALDELGGALRGLYGGQAESFDAWPRIEQQIVAAKVIPLSQRLRKRATLWMSMSTAAVAAAVLAVLFIPRGGSHPSNDCQVDEIEVSGAVDTILKLDDDDHGGSTTVVWIEE